VKRMRGKATTCKMTSPKSWFSLLIIIRWCAFLLEYGKSCGDG
jgi:hypothetical protein